MLQAGADLPQRFESIRRVALAGDRQQPQLRLQGEAMQTRRLMKTEINASTSPPRSRCPGGAKKVQVRGGVEGRLGGDRMER